ncbi:MAG TPA: N-acetylneuraminate synthase family protein [Oligoflexia bacterium]|nr:N-acetylneuraminate synthase family protein [Oligoflexia bacterium]HMP48500.1 N-acetylneuraminate synthase family protein [Oligoflexia bacterium]
MQIGNIELSKNGPLYFVADIGANHDGSLDRAFKLIELAKNAGAHAAKFQNFQADKIVSSEGFSSLGGQLTHQAKWKKSVYETYMSASIPMDWTVKLKEKCEEVGIEYFTSPYDFESVDAVDPYVRVYKIGSGDITWIQIVRHIAKKNKPILLATGASSMDDVRRAMNEIMEVNPQVVLMQCNTNYTGSPDNFNYVNLNVIRTFEMEYPDTILGLSDHTSGHAAILGAIALGARVFEKHFTDDNSREGPDHAFAMNPDTWKEMVERSCELYSALGDGIKRIEKNETESAIVQRRSIRVSRDLPEGHSLSSDDLEVLRPIPEGGLPPYLFEEVVGKKLLNPVKKGQHLSHADILK